MAQMQVYGNTYDSAGKAGLEKMFAFEFEEYAEEALAECGVILESKMKTNARKSVMHDGESEMVDSIKSYKPFKAKNGAWLISVGPSGYSKTKRYHTNWRRRDGSIKKSTRSYSVSNALKAIWKEYGIPSRGIPAQPFISTAVSQCENQVQTILQHKFEERIKE